MAERAEVISMVSPKVGEAQDVKSTNTITGDVEQGDFDSFSTMEDMKEKAPELYQAMMQGIALKICNENQKHQKRFRDILRKARDNT